MFKKIKSVEAVLDQDMIQSSINIANINAEKKNKCKILNKLISQKN